MAAATLTNPAAVPARLPSAVAFALVLLAPIVVNIFAFHYFLTPGSYGLAAVIVVLQAYLAWTRRAAYFPLFTRTTATAK